MIGKLFNRFCLLSLVMAFAFNINAQTTTINTNYTTTGNWAFRSNTTTDSMVLTFTVTNGNNYPIILTEVSNYYVSTSTLGYNYHGDGWTLWRSGTSLTGAATITTAGGFSVVDHVPTYTTAGNGPTPLFTGIEDQVPANSTVRYAIVLRDDTITMSGPNGTTLQSPPATPKFFTANGVVLTAISPNCPSGVAPNAALTVADTLGFWGGIKFESLKPPIIKYAKYQVCLDADICIEATADPYYQNPTFTWYKGTSSTPVFVGSKLCLTNSQFSDSGTYRVEVTGTNTSHTSNQTLVSVEVIDPPAPAVTGKFNYCLNEPFEPVTVLGGTAKWYYTETGGSPIPITPTINTSTPNTLFHYVSVTNALGCESSKRTLVKFNAAPKPAPPVVTTPIYYCEDVPAEQLRAIGDTLRWYYHEVGGVPSSIAPTPNTTKVDSFLYYVSQYIDGCESDRNKIDVVVTFRPNGQILVDKEEICENDSIVVNYYGSAFPGSGYLWSLPYGATLTNGGLNQGPLVMRLDSPGIQRITLQVGHTGCFSTLYEDFIGVKARPTGTILAKEDLCLNQSDLISMDTYTKTTDDFAWDFDGGIRTHFTTDQGPYGIHWSTPGYKTVSVTLTDSGCTSVITDTVLVHEKPDAQIVAEYAHEGSYGRGLMYVEGDTICSSDSLKVQVNTLDASAKYQWTPSIYFLDNNDGPVTYARLNREDTIVLRVEDELGCHNTDSLYIPTRQCCDIFFPNAFTPNNDGHNDRFRPITIGNQEVRTFRVVNRYGQTVFETTDPVRGWDGTLNGEPLDLGTYFYLVSFRCDGKIVDQAGEVVLIR